MSENSLVLICEECGSGEFSIEHSWVVNETIQRTLFYKEQGFVMLGSTSELPLKIDLDEPTLDDAEENSTEDFVVVEGSHEWEISCRNCGVTPALVFEDSILGEVLQKYRARGSVSHEDSD